MHYECKKKIVILVGIWIILIIIIIWACPHFSHLPVPASSQELQANEKNGVGLSANSWLTVASSANRLAVSSAVSPARRSLTKLLFHQATASIPHAKTMSE